MNKLIALKVEDVAVRSITKDGDIVTCVHTVKTDKVSTERFNLTWRFDFTGIPHDDVVMFAARAMLIKKQGKWRAAKDQNNSKVWDDLTISVSDMLTEGRKSASKEEKVSREFAKMSADEKVAMLAKLQAEIA